MNILDYPNTDIPLDFISQELIMMWGKVTLSTTASHAATIEFNYPITPITQVYQGWLSLVRGAALQEVLSTLSFDTTTCTITSYNHTSGAKHNNFQIAVLIVAV